MPYPATIFFLPLFFLQCHLLFTFAAYIQVHFRLDVFMEANIMHPDQTAPKGAVWSGSISFAI